MAESEQLTLRFRHHDGDIGPLTFPDSATIGEVKDKVISEWPKGERKACGADSG